MATLIESFEKKASANAADLEAARAQGEVITKYRWNAGWEGVYNAPGVGSEQSPPGGVILQYRMNNYIKAMGFVVKFLEGTFTQQDFDEMTGQVQNIPATNIPAALAGVAQYDLGTYDNT